MHIHLTKTSPTLQTIIFSESSTSATIRTSSRDPRVIGFCSLHSSLERIVTAQYDSSPGFSALDQATLKQYQPLTIKLSSTLTFVFIMAPIKPTPAVQPMARKSSQYLQNSLRTYELELEDSEKAVAGLDKQISIRQNRMKELQAAEINPANKFSNKARVDNIANAKKLNDLNTLKEQLPEAIETTKQRITDMSKELKETIAYEKKIYAAVSQSGIYLHQQSLANTGQRAANVQQHTSTLPGKRSLPNTQYKDGVAPEAHIRVRFNGQRWAPAWIVSTG